MKIVHNNIEYGYQPPMAQNIDVLLDVVDKTNGIVRNSSHNLSNSITNYERLIVTV